MKEQSTNQLNGNKYDSSVGGEGTGRGSVEGGDNVRENIVDVNVNINGDSHDITGISSSKKHEKRTTFSDSTYDGEQGRGIGLGQKKGTMTKKMGLEINRMMKDVSEVELEVEKINGGSGGSGSSSGSGSGGGSGGGIGYERGGGEEEEDVTAFYIGFVEGDINDWDGEGERLRDRAIEVSRHGEEEKEDDEEDRNESESESESESEREEEEEEGKRMGWRDTGEIGIDINNGNNGSENGNSVKFVSSKSTTSTSTSISTSRKEKERKEREKEKKEEKLKGYRAHRGDWKEDFKAVWKMQCAIR